MPTLPPRSPNMTQDGGKKLVSDCNFLSRSEIKFCITANPSLTHHSKFGAVSLDIYYFWATKSKLAKR